MRDLLKGCTLLATILLARPVPGAAPPPVSAYVSYAQYEEVQISPGGKHLAMTQRTDETETIRVFRYPAMTALSATRIGERIIVDRLTWASDQRLLMQPGRRLPGIAAGHVWTGEIFGMDADGKRLELLFGPQAGQQVTRFIERHREWTNSRASILGTLPDDPDHVLLESWSREDNWALTSVIKMNVHNGHFDTVALGPMREASFVLDAARQVRFAYGQDKQGDMRLYHRGSEDGSWNLLATYPQFSGSALPTGETGSGEMVVVDNHDTDTYSVAAWQLDGNGRRQLFNNPVADVSRWHMDPQQRAWVYEYYDHFPAYWYPNAQHPLARMHRELRASFRNADIRVTSTTHDMSLAVVVVRAPQVAPTFLVVEVSGGRILHFLPAYPALKREFLSRTDPIELRSRDGTMLRGYLTTPGGSAPQDLPMVVLVHGGPHGPYDRYGFDPEVQLLASRGYAVLQVNYRGSGGRGRSFEIAGYGQWGRQMQDDITDAVRWAIADGVADRERVCIVGASYGAYAALTGAFREPSLFKCAVGLYGIYDLPLMFEKGDIQERSAGIDYLRKAVGTDETELRARSPVYNAEKITSAVLLIHGRDDVRAPFAHAERMRTALTRAGNRPEWLAEPGEGHGFASTANRIAAYESILGFLSRHIGGAGP